MILILKITFHENYFLIFAPLRDLQFHRICLVTRAVNYLYVCSSGALHIRSVAQTPILPVARLRYNDNLPLTYIAYSTPVFI